jgi:hypothetical protein
MKFISFGDSTSSIVEDELFVCLFVCLLSQYTLSYNNIKAL